MLTHQIVLMTNRSLILDFGNTFQKCAYYFNGHYELELFSGITIEKIQPVINKFNIENVILSSVIDYPAEIKNVLKKEFFFIELDHYTPLPINNLYKTPSTLGKDRLAAVVGLSSLYPNQNSLCIDCGTAIKYDMINDKNEYKGGGIAPGFSMRFKALHTFTDKLPLVAFESIPPLIGKNTFESISSGVFNGTLAEINGIIERYQNEYANLNIVLTGGEMIYFEKNIKSSIFADPYLVLKGLHHILTFNKQSRSD